MRATARMAVWLIIAAGCGSEASSLGEERKAIAERFFRGIYGCDSSVVDALAAPDVVLSYQVFETIYGTGAFRGRDSVRAFADRFCSRWVDAEVTVYEALAEDDRVVLLWGFRARRTTVDQEETAGSDSYSSWGGISLFRFDDAGMIVLEVGEESEPGPFARMSGTG